jgi:hypothetical protein
MAGEKRAIARTRFKVRIINFADGIVEGYVFLAYNQRLSDLLNDDRSFLPLETEAGELRVIAKRAIMEVDLIEASDAADAASPAGEIVSLIAGNAHEILGVALDAPDAEVRMQYLAKKATVDPQRVDSLLGNEDMTRAAAQLARRYDAAFDSIANSRKVDAIAMAMREAQPRRRRFGEA